MTKKSRQKGKYLEKEKYGGREGTSILQKTSLSRLKFENRELHVLIKI